MLQSQIGYEHPVERIPMTQGIMARAAHTGQVILLEDVRSDADFLGAIEGTCSEIAIPLLRDWCRASSTWRVFRVCGFGRMICGC